MNVYRIIYLPAGAFGFFVNKSAEVIRAYLKRGFTPTYVNPADPGVLIIATM